MSADTPNLDADLFIGGVWQVGENGVLANIDPGNGTQVGAVSLATSEQVEQALTAAADAFPAWSTAVASERGRILVRASQILADRLDEASATLLFESGKTKADARAEILRAIDNLRWNGEQAGRLEGTSYPGVATGSRRRSTPTALGVVTAITAWNFPAVLITRKLGAALAAGCTVVLKASEFTPATARLLLEVFEAAELPPGVVNLVFGDPREVSEQLLASSHVKALTFTGSTPVGRTLASLAANRLVRCVFELGGHAPVIVWDDADIERVVVTTAPAKFGSAGQSCVAPTRFFVHEAIAEQFTAALSAKAESYVLGHGNDEGVTMGAVAHQGRVDVLTKLAEEAVSRGAKIETGGQRVDRDGFYFAPTVLSGVPAEAAVMHDEPFGPICTVTAIGTIDEAIALANENPYSFAAYLFTDSLAIRDHVTATLNASNIGINQTAPSLPDAPLGGLGNSGYGYEGGIEGILAFTHLRLVSESA